MADEHTHIEEPLLELVSRGSQSAFTELFLKYSKLLYSFLYEHTDSPELADDLVQDIFTRIWLARESLAEIRRFRSFLFVLARNHALNDIKKRVRERQRNADWFAIQSAPEEEADRRQWDFRLDIIEQAVEQLPGQQKKVWVMSRRKGMKHNDIAKEMKLSKETVKKYVQYANSAIMEYVISRADMTLIFLSLIFFKKY